ncbi:MAG: hypothetical protein AAF585_10915, partial [Verrucomicrobiota bacterium]
MGNQKQRRRVAISLEMDWGFRHHLDIYAGCQRFADEAGWESIINPAADRELKMATESGSDPPFDGVLARANNHLVEAT